MKMSVQPKDTQPNICKLGAQHDARFGCSTGLGTRPVIDDTAPPGVECPMQIAFAFATRTHTSQSLLVDFNLSTPLPYFVVTSIDLFLY